MFSKIPFALSITCILTLPLSNLCGQKLDYKLGEFIVCLHSGEKIDKWVRQHQRFDNKRTHFKKARCLSDQLNIWNVQFDHNTIHESRFLEKLSADPAVAVVQRNHFLKKRERVPNDPLLENQWHWINLGMGGGVFDADIDMEEAWDISTGGITALGDTIVVAVIDNGVELNHEDLNTNIWYNRNEIPNNGRDDDGNGYIDDYRGWNVVAGNDDVSPEQKGANSFDDHGTEVAGMIGAIGNNNLGVIGVNWNVKIMNVTLNLNLLESDMLACYSYIYIQRKLYNESDGTQGAFVVATNLSYGEEDINPEDAPIWCSFYDSLGNAGILNCAATSNRNVNIDEIKDVPTSCESDFMISVTMTDDKDIRSGSGYGIHDIDIAAPGKRIFTTTVNGTYQFDSGTSFASPVVAGAIALLYSSPCSDIATLARSNPAEAAILVRDLVFNTVDSVESLAREVKTAGRINIFKALARSVAVCNSCPSPFDVSVTITGPDAEINWNTPEETDSINLRYRLSGDTNWIDRSNVVPPLQLDDLMSCSEYELQLQSICSDSIGIWAPYPNFQTEFCCSPPTNLILTGKTDRTVSLSWDSIEAAMGFQLRYKPVFMLTWDTVLANEPNFLIQNLMPCTEYQFQVQSVCDTGLTFFSDTLLVRTYGCGSCLDSVYCSLILNHQGSEWIDSFSINEIENGSGSDDGYGDYTSLSTILMKGRMYSFHIEPGFEQDVFEEYYYIWIDYNQNAEFENEELVYSTPLPHFGPLSGSFVIPPGVEEGSTRMRVMMLFSPEQDTVSGCTTIIELGEAEDYCVSVLPNDLTCFETAKIDTVNLMPESVEIVWAKVDSAIGYTYRYRMLGSDEWEELVDTARTYTLEGLEMCTEYEFQVRSVCIYDTSAYTESFIFQSFCPTSAEELEDKITLDVFPNPFHEIINVGITAVDGGNGQLSLYDLQGRTVFRKSVRLPSNNRHLFVERVGYLPSGVYFMQVYINGRVSTRKLIKH